MKKALTVDEMNVSPASKHFFNNLSARQTLAGASSENCRNPASRFDMGAENLIESDASVVISEAGHDDEVAITNVMFPHPCSLEQTD
jgi:hypothetical protein